MPTGTLTTKGQITIPKEVWDVLQLKAGQRVRFQIIGDRVEMRPLRKNIRDPRGFLFKYRKAKSVSVEEMKEAAETAAAQSVIDALRR